MTTTDNVLIKEQINKIQADLKNFQPSSEAKDKKRHLEALITDLASMIEECFEFRQSLRELREFLTNNDNQLKLIRNQLKDPHMKQAQKDHLTQALNAQIETGKKNRQIEDELKNKLRMTNQQLLALRDLLLKTFEDQLSLIMRQELKELHLKQENIELQMTNMSLNQDSASKAAQIIEKNTEIKDLKEIIDRKEQMIKELQTKIEAMDKQPPSGLTAIKTSNDRLYGQKKPFESTLTPKMAAKLRGSNKSTDMKPDPNLRFLNQDKSLSPKPSSALFMKFTSPMQINSGNQQYKPNESRHSKKLWECQSPKNGSFVAKGKENIMPVSSHSQNLREKSPNSSAIRYGPSRYSDVHEANKNKPVIAKIELSDLKGEFRMLDTIESKPKNNSFRGNSKSISQCLSNEYDNGSVSTLEINGTSKDLNQMDLHESKDAVKPVKNSINSKINHIMTNYTIVNKSNVSGELKPKHQIEIKKKITHSFVSRTPVLNSKELIRSKDNSSNPNLNNKPKILFGSADLQKDEYDSSKPLQTCPAEIASEEKILISSTSQSINSNAYSMKKVTPRDRKIRDITNIYSPEQNCSSNKKNSFCLSQHDSIVRFETSIKKKSTPKVDSYLKKLTSELKNPLDSESEYYRGSQIDSPEPQRINRNLTTTLLQDTKKSAFAAAEDFYD